MEIDKLFSLSYTLVHQDKNSIYNKLGVQLIVIGQNVQLITDCLSIAAQIPDINL